MKIWIYEIACVLLAFVASDVVGKYEARVFNHFWYLRVLQAVSFGVMWATAYHLGQQAGK